MPRIGDNPDGTETIVARQGRNKVSLLLTQIKDFILTGVGVGGSLPDGGTTGQVLTKASNADGDADWESGVGGGGGGGSAAEVTYTLDNTTPTDVVLDLTVMAMRVGITTDGSALAQVVNLPNFTPDGNGVASQYTGYRVTFTCDVQTDPGDVPLVTQNGNGNIVAKDSSGQAIAAFTQSYGVGPVDAIPIDYAGATTSFVWGGEGWFYDDTDFNNDADRILANVLQYGSYLSPENTVTVAALLSLSTGSLACVSDALNPVAGQTVVGGGAVVTPVSRNGSAWICLTGVGFTGSFAAGTDTVTVVNGIITDVSPT